MYLKYFYLPIITQLGLVLFVALILSPVNILNYLSNFMSLDSLNVGQFLYYTFLNIPTVIGDILYLALFFILMFFFLRLANQNEMVILYINGVDALRLLKIYSPLLLALLLFQSFNHFLIKPFTFEQSEKLIEEFKANKFSAFNLANSNISRFYISGDNHSNLLINDSEKNQWVYFKAKSHSIDSNEQGVKFRLNEGILISKNIGDEIVKGKYETTTLNITDSKVVQESDPSHGYNIVDFFQIKEKSSEIYTTLKLRITKEVNQIIALIIIFMFAIKITFVKPRTSHNLRIIIGITIFVFYYESNFTMLSLAEENNNFYIPYIFNFICFLVLLWYFNDFNIKPKRAK